MSCSTSTTALSSLPPLQLSSSISLTSEPVLPYLFTLIMDNEWGIIHQCLNSKDASELCKETDETALSCLALALGHNAPLSIIKSIIHVAPYLVHACDDYGASVLHISCLNGSPLTSIALILNMKRSLATQLDCDGRSPLHHAVEYACSCITSDPNDEETYKPLSYFIALIRMICDVAPETVHMADQNHGVGITPLDIVQLYKAGEVTDSEFYQQLDLIYTVLRQTSICVYKRYKETWERDHFLFLKNHIGLKL